MVGAVVTDVDGADVALEAEELELEPATVEVVLLARPAGADVVVTASSLPQATSHRLDPAIASSITT